MYKRQHKFLVRTYHKPLTWLKSSRPNSLLRRWELRISEFDFDSEQRLEEYEFDVEHRAGRSHGNADALSRRPLDEQPLVAAVLPCNTLSPDFFRSVQSLDGQFSSLVSNINQSTCPEEEVIRGWSRFHQQVFAVWPELSVNNGVLMRESLVGDNISARVVIPPQVTKQFINDFHRSTAGGHMGMSVTKNKMRERYWWPNMARDIEKVVRSCEVCQKMKPVGKSIRGPLHPIKCGYPMQTMHVDIAGPLQRSEYGERYIILMVDAFSGWIEAASAVTVEAEKVAQVILDQWVFRFGCPERIVSDQGGNVAGEIIQQMCRLLNVQKKRTTPYHPQANGKAERSIGTVKRLLRAMIDELGRGWPELLQGVLFSVRSAVNRSSGYTPHYILFGREMCFPNEQRPGKFLKDNSVAEYVQLMADRIYWLQRKARETIGKNKRIMKAVYDKGTKKYPFHVGDKVFRINKGPHSRTIPRLGPYVVTEVRDAGVFKIIGEVEGKKGQVIVVNGRDLTHCTNTPPIRRYNFDLISTDEDCSTVEEDSDATKEALDERK